MVYCYLYQQKNLEQQSLFPCGEKHSFKGATLKGKNLLPEGSKLFPLRVAPMRIESYFKVLKLRLRQN